MNVKGGYIICISLNGSVLVGCGSKTDSESGSNTGAGSNSKNTVENIMTDAATGAKEIATDAATGIREIATDAATGILVQAAIVKTL